jgi:uncharacterized protein involved in tolerance to divalent cations
MQIVVTSLQNLQAQAQLWMKRHKRVLMERKLRICCAIFHSSVQWDGRVMKKARID